jgi:hypothetical protein
VARCHLICALAPSGLSARRANLALNEYVADKRRALPIVHDHFVGRPHGGFVVAYPTNRAQLALFDDPGPLEGWEIVSRPLTFSLTPVGFSAQVDFTLENYGGTSLEKLRADEPRDRRYWWQREKTRT